MDQSITQLRNIKKSQVKFKHMKRQVLGLLVLLICLTLLHSCKKDSATTPIDTTNNGTYKVFTDGNVTTVQNLSADTIIGTAVSGQPFGSGKYTFFSVEQKQLISNNDSATNRWDLGFRGTTIIINGGSSGPGNGGAFVWNGVFNDLSLISADSTFRVDNGSSYAIATGSGRGWYNYNGPVNLVTPLPGKVLVVKTAGGKYVKIEILNYYRGGQTPSSSATDEIKIKEQRYFTFRFVYQPDGSKKF